jgi:DNA-directed RNA polymerase specialized sigma24 family protein
MTKVFRYARVGVTAAAVALALVFAPLLRGQQGLDNSVDLNALQQKDKEQCIELIYSEVRRTVGIYLPADEADLATHEVLMTLYRRSDWSKLRGISAVTAYARSAAKHHAAKLARDASKSVPLESDPVSEDVPEDPRLEVLTELYPNLGPREQLIIDAMKMGLKDEEIASALQLSRTAVLRIRSKIVQTARKKLWDHLNRPSAQTSMMDRRTDFPCP